MGSIANAALMASQALHVYGTSARVELHGGQRAQVEHYVLHNGLRTAMIAVSIRQGPNDMALAAFWHLRH
jgi:hypothetical protein